MPRSQTWRDQRERRFRVEPGEAARVLDQLARRLPLLSYAPGSTLTYVVTTYFDSPGRDYLAVIERTGGHLSLKLRVREYLAVLDGDQALVPTPSCFLERKERIGDVRLKQRIELAKSELARVLRRDASLEGDEAVVRALEAELAARALEPVLVSGYRRRVFGDDAGLKVTVDEQIGFHTPPARLYEQYAALVPDVLGPPLGHGPACVLELKQPRGLAAPDWLTSLVAELAPIDRFSKFREGMRLMKRAGRPGADRAGAKAL